VLSFIATSGRTPGNGSPDRDGWDANIMTVSIDLLREFAVLAEERHFTRAARRLYISQPSLSKHISQLEEALQVTLFKRETPLRLSRAGEVLLESCLSIFESYDLALHTISVLRSGQQLSLRLAGPFYCRHFSQVVMPSVNAVRQNSQVDIRMEPC